MQYIGNYSLTYYADVYLSPAQQNDVEIINELKDKKFDSTEICAENIKLDKVANKISFLKNKIIKRMEIYDSLIFNSDIHEERRRVISEYKDFMNKILFYPSAKKYQELEIILDKAAATIFLVEAFVQETQRGVLVKLHKCLNQARDENNVQLCAMYQKCITRLHQEINKWQNRKVEIQENRKDLLSLMRNMGKRLLELEKLQSSL